MTNHHNLTDQRLTSLTMYISGPVTLKKDVNLIINMFSMHRDKGIWSEPDKFNPLRFTPEEKAKRHPYSYIPFSAGFRGCIGKPFAFLTIKCILSHIVRRYTILNDWKMDDIVLESDISVRSTNGYWIQIKARKCILKMYYTCSTTSQ